MITALCILGSIFASVFWIGLIAVMKNDFRKELENGYTNSKNNT